MRRAYLGPGFDDAEIIRMLDGAGAVYEVMETDAMLDVVAEALANDQVVGWFQGRMEFGPRALGHRSIIGDPRSPKMQSTMNLKIKHRESFRPFAPSVLEERAAEWFDLDVPSPYMMLTAPVTADHRAPPPTEHCGDLPDWVNGALCDIPAVTHVDYSARLQTVNQEQSPEFYEILKAFDDLTGCPVLINTSFNVRGEPIVCTPEDAYRCFMRTEMDALVIENFVMLKDRQPAGTVDRSRYLAEFALD